MARSTSCAERERLDRIYNAYHSDYQRALKVLEKLIGVMPKEEYQNIRIGAETSLKRAHIARRNLDAHVADHRCDEEPAQVDAARAAADHFSG